MTLMPLSSAKGLVEQVHERLVAAIADGTLPPGHRMRQDEIAAHLGVSRQPVSHALIILKSQGLLTEHGRKGLAVAGLDAVRVRDLYRVRACLDALAARLAAERARAGKIEPGEKEELRAVLAAGTAMPDDAPAGDFIRADLDFHTAIYRLSGNAAVEETVTPQWPHFMRFMGLVLARAEYRPRIWAEHRMVFDAILAGDAEGAAALAAGHAETAGEDLCRRLGGAEAA